MVFSSLTFLFLFLPIVIITYYVTPKRFKNFILVVFSFFFYFYGGPQYLTVMIASISINYIFGILVEKTKASIKLCKVILATSVVVNLSILIFYKYIDFGIENINWILNTNIQLTKIIMPIGISFFTFQAMSYVIDVYRGQKVQYNPLNMALYIALFPQLIAGPIVRYETIAEQIGNREETVDKFIEGIERFIFGLGKKVLIANTVGIIADSAFAIETQDLSIVVAWIGAIAYSCQIYFDFSGYSDMAIGLGKIFGFEFLENFNYPYISKSITEFWRRWHISLSSWFRDYVYIPLGGNRGGVKKHLRNLLIVWFLTGIWHGASWTFVVWGLYFGVILALEKYLIGKYLQKLPKAIQHFYALILIIIGWVFFRAEDFIYAFQYLKTMFFMNGAPIIDKYGSFLIHDFKVELIIAIIAVMPISKYIKKNYGENMVLKHIFLFIILVLSVMMLIKSSFNPFIYFRF